MEIYFDISSTFTEDPFEKVKRFLENWHHGVVINRISV